MTQVVINLNDNAQVLERDPAELSEKVVEELMGLVQQVGEQQEANSGAKATDWAYRVPFAGVRYYSYE